MIRLPFALALALPMLAAPPARADPADDDARFTYLVGEYFRSWAAAHPTEATDLGLHDHDRSLEDLSPLGVKHEVRRLRHYQAQFHALDGRTLPPAHAADLAMVEGRIAADLLDLERTQPFCHRADEYPSLASETIYVLI